MSHYIIWMFIWSIVSAILMSAGLFIIVKCTLVALETNPKSTAFKVGLSINYVIGAVILAFAIVPATIVLSIIELVF